MTGNALMTEKKRTGLKRQLPGIVMIAALAVLTLYILSRQTNGLRDEVFLHFFRTVHPFWLVLCGVSMVLMVFCEGFALKAISGKLGYGHSLPRAAMWAASDYYFSGLTPCATGGQPMAVYFMNKDGIPVSKASAALVLNTLIYTLSLLLLGAVGLVCYPSLFWDGTGVAQGFLLYGFLSHSILVGVCLLCMFRRQLIWQAGGWLITLLAKLHLMRHPDDSRASLQEALQDYAGAVTIMRKNPAMLLGVMGWNLLQRCAMAFPLCLLYLGTGGGDVSLWEVFCRSVLCLLSAAAVPIPGTVGISELMYMQFLGGVFGVLTVPATLTNRAIMFYLCVLLCGIWTLARAIRIRRAERRQSLGK